MAYVKKTWVNKPNITTPIMADDLNHIEQGIYDATYGNGVNVSTEVDEDYRVNLIKTVNLFDKNNAKQGYFMTGIETANASWCYNKIFGWNVGDKLTTSGGRSFVSFYNGETNISYNDITNSTITIPANTTIVYVSTLIANDEYQIEIGETATTYSPFIQNSMRVDGTKFTDTINVGQLVDDTYRVNLIRSNNLFDINNMVELIGAYRAFGQGQIVQSASYNGLKIPVKSNTTYTITINANYSNLTYWDNSFTRIGGEAFSHSGGSGTFTTPSGCFYITLAVQNNYTQIMLNEGSTALTYEEFIPNQIVVDNEKYSDTLNVGQFDSRSRVNVLKGKNLFNVNDIYVANAVVQQDGRITGTNDFDVYKLYVKPSTKYTIKATYPRSGDMRIIDYNSSNTLISILTTQNFSANETKTFTITTSSTASYIIFHLIKNNTNTMINEGDTALPYEPYITPSIYVDNEMLVSKNVYSSSEVVIGEWLGKPLYRKVVKRSSTISAGWSGVAFSTLGLSNIEYLRIPSALGKTGNQYEEMVSNQNRIQINIGNSTLSLYLTDGSFSEITFILEYTKTTD